MKKLSSIMVSLQTHYHYKIDFQKIGPTYTRQVVDPRHQTPQGQSVAKHELPCRIS